MLPGLAARNGATVATTEPFVSVVMPIRNEARSIRRSLESVLAQRYPPDRYEVIVADGMSDDGTRAILHAIRDARADVMGGPGVEIIDNPDRTAPAALNRAVGRARGEIILRLDGHGELAPDYLATCARVLDETEADVVGGVARAVGEGRVGRAVAAAFGSRFGVGSAAWHYATQARWVDTVPFACFRRSLVDQVGGFDEELVRNQDDEFNFRVIQAGGRIRLDPRLRSIYRCRSSLSALWRQYAEYGFYKVKVMRKRRGVASARHLVPGLLVITLTATALTGWLSGRWAPMKLALAAYLAGCVGAGVVAAPRTSASPPLVSAAFATMHVAYGLGSLRAAVLATPPHART